MSGVGRRGGMAAVVLGIGVLAGCAPPAAAPPRSVAVVPVAEPDHSGLAILLAPEVDPSATRQGVTNVLRTAMLGAGYHVVAEPRDGWDVELVPRVDVWGRELELSAKPGDPPLVHEHVKLTVTAVADHAIVASVRLDLTVTDGNVGAGDVVPALNALAGSDRFRRFVAKCQREREAHARRVAVQ